jgi:RimJ/RimL family protein N-acetyltransferase
MSIKVFSYKNKKIKKIFINNNYFYWLNVGDLNLIRIWRNNQKKILRQNKNINTKNQKNYFKNFYKQNCLKKKPQNILFALKDKKLIGYGGLTNISWENRRAEVSFLLNTKISKKKIYKFYFLKFLNIISKFSFRVLNLNKIYTETFTYRKAHIKLLEKSGFNKETSLISHYYKNNKFIHAIIHSKFRKY